MPILPCRACLPPIQTPSKQAGDLIGNWSTTAYAGDLVNPNTGAFLQSAYTGQSYVLHPDGTYRYSIAASGQFITAVVIENGTYTFQQGRLLLHRKTQSWYPSPRDAARRPMYRDKPSAEIPNSASNGRAPLKS